MIWIHWTKQCQDSYMLAINIFHKNTVKFRSYEIISERAWGLRIKRLAIKKDPKQLIQPIRSFVLHITAVIQPQIIKSPRTHSEPWTFTFPQHSYSTAPGTKGFHRNVSVYLTEKEREFSHPMVHSPNACNSRDQARL